MQRVYVILLAAACGLPEPVATLCDAGGEWDLARFEYESEAFTGEASGGYLHFVSDLAEAESAEDRANGHGDARTWRPVTIGVTTELVPVLERFEFQPHRDGSLAFVWDSDHYDDLWVRELSPTRVVLESGVGGSWDEGDAVRRYTLER